MRYRRIFQLSDRLKLLFDWFDDDDPASRLYMVFADFAKS